MPLTEARFLNIFGFNRTDEMLPHQMRRGYLGAIPKQKASALRPKFATAFCETQVQQGFTSNVSQSKYHWRRSV